MLCIAINVNTRVKSNLSKIANTVAQTSQSPSTWKKKHHYSIYINMIHCFSWSILRALQLTHVTFQTSKNPLNYFSKPFLFQMINQQIVVISDY